MRYETLKRLAGDKEGHGRHADAAQGLSAEAENGSGDTADRRLVLLVINGVPAVTDKGQFGVKSPPVRDRRRGAGGQARGGDDVVQIGGYQVSQDAFADCRAVQWDGHSRPGSHLIGLIRVDLVDIGGVVSAAQGQVHCMPAHHLLQSAEYLPDVLGAVDRDLGSHRAQPRPHTVPTAAVGGEVALCDKHYQQPVGARLAHGSTGGDVGQSVRSIGNHSGLQHTQCFLRRVSRGAAAASLAWRRLGH
jgi:hypothetical protein